MNRTGVRVSCGYGFGVSCEGGDPISSSQPTPTLIAALIILSLLFFFAGNPNAYAAIQIIRPGTDRTCETRVVYAVRMLDFGRSMAALNRERTSKPNRPSMGLSAGSSWQATGTLRNIDSKIRNWGTTTNGMNSLPLAVSVSRKTVDRAGFKPIASAAFGGIMVVVAPVSRARRTKRLPFGPRSLTYIIRRPASLSRGYSRSKGDRVTMRQGFVRVHGDTQPPDLHETIVNIVPMRGMGQQVPAKRYLGMGVHSIHGNKQPFSMESFPNLINRLLFHRARRIP